MADPIKIGFTIHAYDSDGDIYENGIYLHFEHTAIRVCDSIEDFDKVVENIKLIQKELKEN